MNKEQFMKEMESLLRKLPANERNDILQDFEEHFEIGISEGKNEQELSESLGNPSQIAKELSANYHIEKVEGEMSTGNILRAVWAVISLGFFNLIIVIGPFLALASLVLAGWITGLTFIVSPILFTINVLIYPDTFLLFDLSFSLLLAGIGLLLVVLMFYVTKFLSKAFIRYLKYNVNLVKGGMKHA